MNKKRKARIVLAVGLSIIAVTLVIISLNNNLTDSKEKECIYDSDCVKVQTNCCSCENGGEEMCVNKAEAVVYENKIKNCSENEIFCASVYNCKTEACGCVKGECK